VLGPTLRSPPARSPASAITQDASIGKQQSAHCAILRVRGVASHSRRKGAADRWLYGCGLGKQSRRSAIDQRVHHKIGRGAVIWKSKKQSCVVLSSTEAEYMTLCQAAKESIWMVDFLKDLGISVSDSIVINVDNQGGIALAKNPVTAPRTSTSNTTTLGI